MGKQKKSLVCMYVDDFCGIEKENFNFNIKRRYMINDGVISRKASEEIADFPTDFWGKNISALTLLIGENGAGKTTLMRLLIKWLCQLSVGHIPQEKGALVISVGDEDRLIAFNKGKSWRIQTHENIVCIQDTNKIKELLSDIRLAYYTDTMTDLELDDILTSEELEFLQDDSLLTRLSNSMEGKYELDSVKNCIKREDFRRQMELFLNISNGKKKSQIVEFPIRYMKLTALKAGDKESFDTIKNGNESLIREAMDLWNKVFDDDINNELSDIAKDLLWGLFSGIIVSLINWEKTLPYVKESIITGQIGLSLRAYIRSRYFDWNTVLKRFFVNLFRDCEGGLRIANCDEKFRKVWNMQVEDNINNFLDTLKRIEGGEFLKKWTPHENIQNIWEFKLMYFDKKNSKEKKDEKEHLNLIQDWKCLWEHYLTVAHLMPKCRFDWKYASSGGKNQSNLYAILYNIVVDDSSKSQLWFLLDEPDNTFHPDWKRKIIQNLLKACSSLNINLQLMISTHSPIMLSDVPKQAAILLKNIEKDEENDITDVTMEKQQKYPKSSPFGQQIYTLFNDAFFMEQGIIGGFADTKINGIYKELCRREKQISERRDDWNEDELNSFEKSLEKCGCIIKLLEEPILHGYLSQSYKLCKRRMKELQQHYSRKEDVISD